MKLQRFPGNPILTPHPHHPWEDLAVFNPAAWYDEQTREVLLLYRAAESRPEYRCSLASLSQLGDGFCRNPWFSGHRSRKSSLQAESGRGTSSIEQLTFDADSGWRLLG